jgi:hypothetical protein
MTGARKPAWRETIVSMVPAQPGWRALYAGWDERTGGFTRRDVVAVWGLRETVSDGFRFVEGMVADEDGLELAESYRGQSLRYLAPGQSGEDFATEIADRQAELREESRARRAT